MKNILMGETSYETSLATTRASLNCCLMHGPRELGDWLSRCDLSKCSKTEEPSYEISSFPQKEVGVNNDLKERIMIWEFSLMEPLPIAQKEGILFKFY